MNDYKITYTGESEGYQIITERSEAAARKQFRQTHGTLLDITDVALVAENTCATKQQERETLEAIKQMVAELGPQSYLATAFKCCFEDAENNIEYDEAGSMADRWEHAEEELTRAKAEIEALRADRANLLAKWERTSKSLEKAEQWVSSTTLNLRELGIIKDLLDEQSGKYEEAADKAAAEIVKYADHPESKEFQQAVKDHCTAARRAKYYQEVLTRVATIEAAHTDSDAA